MVTYLQKFPLVFTFRPLVCRVVLNVCILALCNYDTVKGREEKSLVIKVSFREKESGVSAIFFCKTRHLTRCTSSKTVNSEKAQGVFIKYYGFVNTHVHTYIWLLLSAEARPRMITYTFYHITSLPLVCTFFTSLAFRSRVVFKEWLMLISLYAEIAKLQL